MATPEPGIWNTFYLGGYEVVRPPGGFDPLDPARMELAQRTISGRLIVNILDVGTCDRPGKLSFGMKWEELSKDEFDQIQRVVALAEFVDFCPWLAMYEAFSIDDGAPLAGLLSRREAINQCSIVPTDTTDLVPVLWVDGTATTLTLGAVDSEYRQAWSAAGVGGTGGSTCVIRYCPLYLVWVTKLPVDHQLPTRTRVSLVAVEA